MTNEKIRNRAKEKNIKLWEVAEKLGLCDSGLSRLLRHELEEQKQKEILSIIDELAATKS